MKTRQTARFIACIVVTICLVATIPTETKAQSSWEPWESWGAYASVQFARVNNKTLTWAFRNSGCSATCAPLRLATATRTPTPANPKLTMT